MAAHLLPGGRRVLILDLLAVLWVAAWIVLGLSVAHEVDGLRSLSATAGQAGRSVEQVGAALDAIDLPFVGGRIDEAARSVREAGAQTVRSAAQTRRSVSDLRVLLGLSVTLIPISPLLLVYLPLRVADLRERRALRALRALARTDPELDRLLTRRALESMSYRRLRALPGRPWDEAERTGARRP